MDRSGIVIERRTRIRGVFNNGVFLSRSLRKAGRVTSKCPAEFARDHHRRIPRLWPSSSCRSRFISFPFFFFFFFLYSERGSGICPRSLNPDFGLFSRAIHLFLMSGLFSFSLYEIDTFLLKWPGITYQRASRRTYNHRAASLTRGTRLTVKVQFNHALRAPLYQACRLIKCPSHVAHAKAASTYRLAREFLMTATRKL